jgi:hypothetical protein
VTKYERSNVTAKALKVLISKQSKMTKRTTLTLRASLAQFSIIVTLR